MNRFCLVFHSQPFISACVIISGNSVKLHSLLPCIVSCIGEVSWRTLKVHWTNSHLIWIWWIVLPCLYFWFVCEIIGCMTDQIRQVNQWKSYFFIVSVYFSMCKHAYKSLFFYKIEQSNVINLNPKSSLVHIAQKTYWFCFNVYNPTWWCLSGNYECEARKCTAMSSVREDES